jgi:hypothetical protein
MSAGCVPVVIANQLSGAFASLVPYSRFWLRVEQTTFTRDPSGLLARLRAVSASELSERRSRMLRHVADVTYAQPTYLDVPSRPAQPELPPPRDQSGAPRAAARTERHALSHAPTRLASNALRAAEAGCMRGAPTPTTGLYPMWHKYADDDKWGLNCSCTTAAPKFWWGPKATRAGSGRGRPSETLWTRGKVPTEVCRCLHCATLCPQPEDEWSGGAPAGSAAGSKRVPKQSRTLGSAAAAGGGGAGSKRAPKQARTLAPKQTRSLGKQPRARTGGHEMGHT